MFSQVELDHASQFHGTPEWLIEAKVSDGTCQTVRDVIEWHKANGDAAEEMQRARRAAERAARVQHVPAWMR